MLASMKGIYLIGFLALIVLVFFLIWLKIRANKKNLLRYSEAQWERQNKNFTLPEDWDEGVGPVRVRIVEEIAIAPKPTCNQTAATPDTARNLWPAVLCVYITNKPGQFFYGYELVQTLLNHGMMHGHLEFFHCLKNDQTWFSLTALEPPGHFHLSDIGNFKTAGLCLFMQPQRFAEPIAVFEQMVEMATKLAEELGGTVEDNNHHLLTQERLNYWCSKLHPAYAALEQNQREE